MHLYEAVGPGHVNHVCAQVCEQCLLWICPAVCHDLLHPAAGTRHYNKDKTVFGQMEGDRFSTTTAVAHVSPEHTGTPAPSCLPSGVSADMTPQQPPSTPFRDPLSWHQAETWKAAANPAWQLPPMRCSTDFHFQSSARNAKAQSHPSQTPSHFTPGCTVEVDSHMRSQTGLQPSAASCAAEGAPLPLMFLSTHSTFPTEGGSWGTRCNEGSFTFSVLIIYRPSPTRRLAQVEDLPINMKCSLRS